MPSLARRFPFLAELLCSLPKAPPRRPPAPTFPVPAQSAARDPDLEELRGEAMRRLFPKLYSWCASRWEWGIALEVHSYLATASSVEDLEQRIRTVERRRHFQA